jgi:uncharacterized protein (TIGR02246 family)
MMTDISQEISAAYASFKAAFAKHDASQLAALYTSDGQLLPANADFVRGTEAIRGFWQGAFEMGLTAVDLQTAEIDLHGDTAIEVGSYRLLAGEAIADSGKYVVVWKKIGGDWKLHRDIWTTSQPAA